MKCKENKFTSEENTFQFLPKKKNDLEPNQVLTKLALGHRVPRNKKERSLLKQIQEIKASGKILEIPQDLL